MITLAAISLSGLVPLLVELVIVGLIAWLLMSCQPRIGLLSVNVSFALLKLKVIILMIAGSLQGKSCAVRIVVVGKGLYCVHVDTYTIRLENNLKS